MLEKTVESNEMYNGLKAAQDITSMHINKHALLYTHIYNTYFFKRLMSVSFFLY